MRDQPIQVTRTDAQVLRSLLTTRASSIRDQEHLEELSFELERAQVLDSNEMPGDVVTMRAKVEVLDLNSGERREFTLVMPSEADVRASRISVLAPLGTAVLGYRVGDEVEWVMPGGPRKLRIESVHMSGETMQC